MENHSERNLWMEIKEKVSIAEYLANKGCRVRHKGKTAHTRCPFPQHDDSTASFVIYSDMKYYCFGCAARPDTKLHAQGDIFDLVGHLDQISKVEVLQQLAAEAGIELEGPQYENLKQRFEESDLRKREANAYEVNLSNSDPWRGYLTGKRNLTMETIASFHLGLDGRNFVSIPLYNQNSQLVGFTKHHPDSEAKYINPETNEAYRKDSYLFNIDSLKYALQHNNTVYITEGYFDVMSLFQAGYKTAVGLCGARLQNGQLKALQKLINEDTKIVFIPDGDAAGWGALQGNFELLRSVIRNSCYVITLPQTEPEKEVKDPNDWFKYNDTLPAMVPYFDAIVQYHIAQAPEDQDLQARRISKALGKANQLEKSRMARTLSAIWDYPEDAVARFINTDPFKYSEQLFKDSVFRIDEYKEYVRDIDKQRLSTGFQEIDAAMRGIAKGEVMGIMGRANVGKTLTITEIFNNLVAASQDSPTVIFSLEMSSVQLQERIIIQALKIREIDGVSPGRLLEKRIQAEDPVVMQMLEDLKHAHRNLVVVDSPGLSVEDMDRILTEIEMTKFNCPVDRVFVDHLTIIKAEGKSDYERTSNAIKGFRNMIRRRATCCAILLIQTSRKGGSGGEPLSMDDCRNSGEVEETLDHLIGCWRPELKAQSEINKIQATPIQPVPKLRKDENGKVQKDGEGRRMYESDQEAFRRAQQESRRAIKLCLAAMDEQRGLFYMSLLKTRREGKNKIWVYRQIGLNLEFVREEGSLTNYVGGEKYEDVEDPLDGQAVSPEDIVFDGADLPGRALLGQPKG